MSISTAIQELSVAIGKGFETLKSYIEHQPSMEIVKEKKQLKKVSNYTEQLINEIRVKAKEYDEILDYSKRFIEDCVSESEYKQYLKKIKHARNSRNMIRLIRKIENLD